VLVAGHALTPCATPYASGAPATSHGQSGTGAAIPDAITAVTEVSPAVARALAYVASHGVTRAIPCPVTGNGVNVHPVEAIGLLALLARTPGDRLADAIDAGMRAHDLSVSHEGETLHDAPARTRAASAAATHVLTHVVPACRRLGLVK
jgi:hypothetical protein